MFLYVLGGKLLKPPRTGCENHDLGAVLQAGLNGAIFAVLIRRF